MHKHFILSLSILFTASVLFAADTLPSIPLEMGKIKQEDVDLNKFQNEEVLKMAVTELSKDLPQKIDEYTTLVDVTKKELTLIYIYEINTGAKSDEAVRAEDHERMRQAVIQGTCQSSQRFLESGISLSYLYNSAKSKEKLFVIDVTKKDCPNLQ